MNIHAYKQTHEALGALLTTVSLWQPTCRALYPTVAAEVIMTS